MKLSQNPCKMKKNFLESVNSLIDSINAVISLNRCSFSTEDLDFLHDCIAQLKQIEDDSLVSFDDRRVKFIQIVSKLDIFFCFGNYLLELFDEIS